VEAQKPPSKKGGEIAAQVFSAAAIAKVLSGIDFPKSKDDIKKYAQKNLTSFMTKKQREEQSEVILDLLNKIPEREYTDMADVEREIGRVLL
jgi:hypothetical protein